MILSPDMKAFDLSQESKPMRENYGDTNFGAGCLMARRLIESGVTFVEVVLDGWDTHDDNFGRTTKQAEVVDKPFAALLADLKQRGMLDSTLVIWMGEFGRTPTINARSGRDHFPKAFNVALAGGGIRGFFSAAGEAAERREALRQRGRAAQTLRAGGDRAGGQAAIAAGQFAGLSALRRWQDGLSLHRCRQDTALLRARAGRGRRHRARHAEYAGRDRPRHRGRLRQ